MKLSLDIDLKSVERAVQQSEMEITNKLIQALFYIGEECVNIARNQGSQYKGLPKDKIEEIRHRPHRPDYIDDTGNLRQSIGYVVAVDGKVVKNGIRSDGSMKIALDTIKDIGKGYSLVLVAGMNYAVDLTFKRGYDVITTASIKATERYKQFVERIKKMYG